MLKFHVRVECIDRCGNAGRLAAWETPVARGMGTHSPLAPSSHCTNYSHGIGRENSSLFLLSFTFVPDSICRQVQDSGP